MSANEMALVKICIFALALAAGKCGKKLLLIAFAN